MTQCWSEGELRAYLDRELAPGDSQRVAAHLKDCPACDRLSRELEQRAERVGALLDLLPELEPETIVLPTRLPHLRPTWARAGWAGTAVALAAGLGIAAYLVPRREPNPVVHAVTAPPAPPAPRPAAAAAVEIPEETVVARPAGHHTRRPVRTAADLGPFVALDDEPFESGVIVRVDVAPGKTSAGKTQADIVFGPDGRARAFRLVKAPRQSY